MRPSPNAVAADESPAVQLVPARRWLIAVSLVVVVLAGIVFLAIATTRSPVRGVAFVDRGGFITLTAPQAGVVADTVLAPGTPVKKGDVIATVDGLSGSRSTLVAPADGVVMQLGGSLSGGSVDQGETVAILAVTEMVDGPNVVLVLPGEEASELTRGQVTDESPVWLEPADRQPFECDVTRVIPYAQPAETIDAVNPDPVVRDVARQSSSILYAMLTCPAESVDTLLPGAAIPATVRIDPRSPLSYILGRRT